MRRNRTSEVTRLLLGSYALPQVYTLPDEVIAVLKRRMLAIFAAMAMVVSGLGFAASAGSSEQLQVAYSISCEDECSDWG
jgi:hypothetical protein